MGKIWDSLDLILGSYDLVRVLCLGDLYLGSRGLYYDLGSLLYPKVTNVTYI